MDLLNSTITTNSTGTISQITKW